MANSLPPVPFNHQIANQSGVASGAWAAWFREVFNRIGGSNGPDFVSIASQISSLTTQVALQQAEINEISSDLGDLSDFNQGPVL